MSAAIENTDDLRLARLQEILDSGAMHSAQRLLKTLTPAEIAHLLESLPPAKREILWSLVDPAIEGEVLVNVSDEVQAELVKDMDADHWRAAAENLDLDDLTDLVQDMPETVVDEVLSALDDQRRHRVEAVLSYPEDTAGGLMNTDTVTVRPEVTLDVVLRYLRRLGEDMPADTDALFVVNRDDEYLGVLPLWKLVSGNPDDTVAEVMSLALSPLPVDMSASEVARYFETHDVTSAPVVDAKGHLLGRITVDDVVDVIREEGEHQFMGQAGLSEEEDMFAPVLASTRRRAVWLGVNLLTAFLASWVIGLFQDTLSKYVALAVLMPIVASMGGIAGSQTLTLAIRGIALGQLTGKNARHLLLKELAVGILNGVIWAVVVGIIAGVWFDNPKLAVLIGVAIVVNLLLAAFSGAVLPLLLKRLGIDPALAGSVLLTTVTDVGGFFAFLGLATLFLI
ncbi:MAG: magnesium transporter [Gammaproteobacteria bacterium]|nr:MAG: magnesium transporter [Gammaproteobacteria bacterium]